MTVIGFSCAYFSCSVVFIHSIRYELFVIGYPRDLHANRPFAAKPCDLLFIKLWAASLRMPEMEKSMSNISKWSSLRPLALKNEISKRFKF